MVECKNCPYFDKGEDDDFAYCHFEGNFLAPCEEDDDEGEPYEDVVDDYDEWAEDEEDDY